MPKGVTTTSTDTVLTICIICSAVPVRNVFISVNKYMMRSFQFGGGREEQFCCRQNDSTCNCGLKHNAVYVPS